MEETNTPKTNADLSSLLAQLTNFFEDIFLKKAPGMPVAVKEILVKYGPYITILMLVLSIPTVLFILGVGAALTPYGYAARAGLGFSFAVIFLVVSMVMQGLSVSGLLARKMSGWNWVYWSVLVNIIYSVLSLNIVGGLISAVLGLWVLFQIREYYR
jgi:hypothetical protein